MKKITYVILLILFGLGLTSCYQDIEKNSLEDYISYINENKCGFSSTSIDHPDYFLPSISFFQDYKYEMGKYFWREDDPLRGMFSTNVFPEISLLSLKYNEKIYYNAKDFMIEKIEPYNNKFYEYNNYMFYENSNQRNLNGVRNFPKTFTMACYNDEKFSIIFIGLYSGTLSGPSCLEQKYLDDIENNWKSFIDTYFGKYYDFGE